MNIPENIMLLVRTAYERRQISAKKAVTILLNMQEGLALYEPPEGEPDPLEGLNAEVIARFNPSETVADLLADLTSENPPPAVRHQAAEVIRQLLNGRAASSVPLAVEDR
jgi:hypothetical protein